MVFELDQPHSETTANFALMDARPGAMLRYWRLAVETSRYFNSLRESGEIGPGISWFQVEDAEIAGRCLEPFRNCAEGAALIDRWARWSEEFEAIHERSPKWRLKRMIGEVSESHSFISWPNRWERSVWEYALSPTDPDPLPFDDRKGIMDSEFRQRLKALVQGCDGFLYRCEETGQIVFAPTASLPRIWKHQDHLAQIDREKPFGFLYDVSRPDWRSRVRPPTEAEERTMWGTKRPPGPGGRALQIWKQVRARLDRRG